MSKAAKVKLVWNGHTASNLDVAQETGNGLLEPGREIHVSPELAELLLRSNVQWEACAAPKPGAKKKAARKPKPPATTQEPAVTEPNEGADGAKEDES